jgi:CheY-like chemotaxis protein
MDSKDVWLLDSNSQNEQLSDLSQLYPGFIRYAKSKNISEQIIALIKPDKTGLLSKISGKSVEKPGYVFIHQGDLINIDPSNLELLKTKDNVVFFSGAVVGSEGKRIYPRSIIYKYLREFINRWFSNSPEDAVVFLASKENKMDSLDSAKNLHLLINWKERHQHDFVNILAPADLNAIFYAGGELNKEQYVKTRDGIKLRVKLAQDKVGKVSFRNLYKEAWQIFENDDPIISIKPDISPERVSIGEIVPATIIHIDDDINNGWDLVFHNFFIDRYLSATNSDQGTKLILEHSDENVVVLLDLGLKPGESVGNSELISGLKFLQEIRKEPLNASLPVFVMSAFDDSMVYEKCMELGATGFIVKPSRILSAKSDVELYKGFVEKFIKVRFAIFKNYIYKAFRELKTNDASETNSEIESLLEAILQTDFSRFNDSTYTANRISSLILSTFKVFEVRGDTKDKYCRTDCGSLVNGIRNFSAHKNIRYNYSFKDLLIYWDMYFDSLEDMDCTKSKSYLDAGFKLIFITELSKEDALNGVQYYFHQQKSSIKNNFLLQRFGNTFRKSSNPKLSKITIILLEFMISDHEHWSSNTKYFSQSLPLDPKTTYKPIDLLDEIKPEKTLNPSCNETVSPKPLLYSNKKNRFAKGMDYWFTKCGDDLIYTKGKYQKQLFNRNDPNQIDYWKWYFSEFVENNDSGYQDDFRTWIKDLLNNFSDQKKEQKENIVPTSDITNTVNEFDLSMVAINSSQFLDVGDLRRILNGLFDDFLKVVNDSKHPVIYWGVTQKGNTKKYYGVRLTLKSDRNGKQYLLLSPSMISTVITNKVTQNRIIKSGRISMRSVNELGPFEEVLEGGGEEFFKTSHVSSLFKEFHEELCKSNSDLFESKFTKSSLFKTGLIKTQLSGTFNDDKQDLKNKLPSSLGNLSICVLNLSDSSESLFNIMQRDVPSLKQVSKINEADAFIVVVNPNLDAKEISEIYLQHQKIKKPWQLINPDKINYKSWNIMVSLTTKIQRPLWDVSIAEERTWFLGLDLGHSKNDNSYLAAVLVNHKGKLISWTKVQNGEHNKNQKMEQISDKSFSEVKKRLLNERNLQCPVYEIDLIVHRDGIDGRNTANDKKLAQNLEQDVASISWVEIIKQGVPCFNNCDGPGAFINFEDINGSEFWLMTAKSKNGNLVKPLKIIVRHQTSGMSSDILATQIYDLSSIPITDYERKQKLPLTTYLADGLSSTGEKRYKFCGFEHLRS